WRICRVPAPAGRRTGRAFAPPPSPIGWLRAPESPWSEGISSGGLRLLNPVQVRSGYHRCVRIGADSLPQDYQLVGRNRRSRIAPYYRANQPLPPPLSTLESVVPSAAGLSATAMPADFMASTLSS